MKFYATILDANVEAREVGGQPGGVLPSNEGAITGVIRCSPEYMKPSDQGALVYLRVEDLDAALSRVEPAGGKVLFPSTDAGAEGRFAWILDSEGNRLGLNQPR
jgi:predicted enzyme related to lactoylglutathione lyase